MGTRVLTGKKEAGSSEDCWELRQQAHWSQLFLDHAQGCCVLRDVISTGMLCAQICCVHRDSVCTYQSSWLFSLPQILNFRCGGRLSWHPCHFPEMKWLWNILIWYWWETTRSRVLDEDLFRWSSQKWLAGKWGGLGQNTESKYLRPMVLSLSKAVTL